MSDNKLVKTIMDAATLTGLASGIGWISKKVVNAHPDYKLSMPKEPKFSDMYQPSDLQKQGELLFVGGGALALGYAAFRFI